MTARRVSFIVPPRTPASVVADFGGGLGFEPLDEYVLPPLDLLQLASCARLAGWECQVVDALAEDVGVDRVIDLVQAFRPTTLVVSGTVPTLEADLALAQRLRPSASHVLLRFRSTDEQELRVALESRAVDACLTDECEVNLAGILEGTDRTGTAHLVDDRIVRESGPSVESLDDLPLPARDLVDASRYTFPKLGRVATVQASRGCPYPCGYYCPYPLVQGRKWRSRSAGSVVEELERLSVGGTSNVLFRDPVFTLDMRRVRDLCAGIVDRGLDLRWWCETRADRLDAELIGDMARAGCLGINVGVESGDPALRFSVLKRGVTDDVLDGVCAAAADHGVAMAFLMMVGFPGETRQGVLRSAELITRCRPAHVGIGFPVDHPGTRFRKDAVANGWVREGVREAATGGLPVVVADLPVEDMIEGRRLLMELHGRLGSAGDVAMDELLAPVRGWANGAAP